MRERMGAWDGQSLQCTTRDSCVCQGVSLRVSDILGCVAQH
jgi:hypothetical protein